MAKTTKLTVTTAVGTFTRTTARTYSHVVVVGPARAEVLEAERLIAMQSLQDQIARYAAAVADNGAASLAAERARVTRNGLTPEQVESWLARIADIHCGASQAKYLADAQASLAAYEAEGPVTEDRGDWTVLGWSGRFDLAEKLASSSSLDGWQAVARFRAVRVYDVATGALVRQHVALVQTPAVIRQQKDAAHRTFLRRARRR